MRSLCFLSVAALGFPLLAPGCAPPTSDVAWTEVARDAMTEGEAAQFERANGAREALFGTLMARLVAAMQDGGAPVAIDVCRVEAPAIASDTGAAHGVAIGRTSFKLRNPENTPPAWAVPHVEARRAEPLVLRGSDGALAALFPIVLKAECVQCHGPEADIAPDVLAAIQQTYPGDTATGFQEGDLRGWFHVIVPPAS